MSLEIWLAYVVATTILLIIPGPTIMLVVAYALGQGKRTAPWTVAGVGLGDSVAMIAAFAGLGAILSASAMAFDILKYGGAAYLIWLGYKMWRAKPDPAALLAVEAGEFRGWRLFGHAFVVTALNPKGMVFFVAFVPQFLNATAPLLPQLVIMGSTFVVLGVLNAAIYALAAGYARERIANARTLKLVNRVGGGFLIGAGLLTAAMKRTA